jgi:hypothetical protein
VFEVGEENIKRVKSINLIALVLIVFVAMACAISFPFAKDLSNIEKIVSTILVLCLSVFCSITYFTKICETRKKYIYFFAMLIVEVAVWYFQNGLFDNTFIHFCFLAMAAMYFDYKFLVITSLSVIITNLMLFAFGKDMFFSGFDGGNFISYIEL